MMTKQRKKNMHQITRKRLLRTTTTHATDQSGFSMVEMMLYIALISIAMVSIVSFSATVRSSRVKARSIEEVQQDARFSMHRMSVAFHNATGVNAATVFNEDAGETDGEIVLDTASGTVTFAIDSGAVTIDEGSGAEAITSDKVEVTEFLVEDRTPGGGSLTTDIKITLQVEHVNPGNAKEFESSTRLETTVSLRP